MKFVIKNNSGCYIVNPFEKSSKYIKKSSDIKSAYKFEEAEIDKIKARLKELAIFKGYNIAVYNDSINPIPTKVMRKKFSRQMNRVTREQIWIKSGYSCQICGHSITYEEMTVDHIQPLAKGGKNEMDNYQCACGKCNKIKADSSQDEFIDNMKDIVLYQMEKEFDKKYAWKIFKLFLKNILTK